MVHLEERRLRSKVKCGKSTYGKTFVGEVEILMLRFAVEFKSLIVNRLVLHFILVNCYVFC